MTPPVNPVPHKSVSPDALEGDLVRAGDPLFGIVWINPERMSGAPCFYGTRVPIKHLFEYLEGGDSLDDFLAGSPGVTREQAVALLEAAHQKILPRDRAA